MADSKDHDNIAIKLKHDNTIKKNAAPDNPAVRIKWSNDVVKRASELNVEKASDSASSKKRDQKKEGDGTITENAESKDIKKRKMEKKSVKTDKKNTKAGGQEKNAAPGHEEQKN
jgi:hypothetical protein